MEANIKISIEKKRRQLNEILNRQGYNKKDAQKLSEELDKLIMKYYKDQPEKI